MPYCNQLNPRILPAPDQKEDCSVLYVFFTNNNNIEQDETAVRDYAQIVSPGARIHVIAFQKKLKILPDETEAKERAKDYIFKIKHEATRQSFTCLNSSNIKIDDFAGPITYIGIVNCISTAHNLIRVCTVEEGTGGSQYINLSWGYELPKDMKIEESNIDVKSHLQQYGMSRREMVSEGLVMKFVPSLPTTGFQWNDKMVYLPSEPLDPEINLASDRKDPNIVYLVCTDKKTIREDKQAVSRYAHKMYPKTKVHTIPISCESQMANQDSFNCARSRILSAKSRFIHNYKCPIIYVGIAEMYRTTVKDGKQVHWVSTCVIEELPGGFQMFSTSDFMKVSKNSSRLRSHKINHKKRVIGGLVNKFSDGDAYYDELIKEGKAYPPSK